MRVSICSFIFLVSIAFTAWFGTFILECYYQGLSSERILGEKNKLKGHQPPFPGGGNGNIVWFLQISDIHLCYHGKKEVAEDLLSFCTDTLDIIKPSLVLATGDLTHAKYPDERWSQQFEQEWKTYRGILETCRVKEKVPWLDIRGNHDNFDVSFHTDDTNRFSYEWRCIDWAEPEIVQQLMAFSQARPNYFPTLHRQYSMTGQHHGSKSYLYTHNTSFGAYSFVGMDACPSPGPKRPFNFFGILHDEDLLALSKLSFQASQHSNQTVWFSHYPSATITSANHHELREIMSSSVAHVCGHLHTLGSYVPRMYGRHPSGHLELELADFTGNRRYRLLAFDHDLFSFTDTTFNKWPLILITNPKDAHFSLPSREPLGRMAHSSHIRLLAFSPSQIVSVEVWVDGEALSSPSLQGGPLFTVPWLPEKYKRGMHQIEVNVKDSAGRETAVSQSFSLDGTTSPLLFFPELLLLTDFRSLFRMGFLFLWLTVLASLLLSLISYGPSSYFYPLVKDKLTFYSLLSYVTYFGLGPWYIGEVLTGVYGVIGVHGVYVGGHFLPGSMTYLHGVIQVSLFYIPLIYYLNHVLSHDRHVTRHRCRGCNCLYHVIMVLALLVQCTWVVSVYPYGKIALILCPGITWSIPFSLALIWRAFRL